MKCARMGSHPILLALCENATGVRLGSVVIKRRDMQGRRVVFGSWLLMK